MLDATTGQNALSQIEIFKEVAGVTGLVMTKLDGTARGGVLVAALVLAGGQFDAASLLTDYFDEYSAMIDSLTDADGNAYSAIDIRKDFAGVARPVNSLYDIGAYEQ